MILSKNFVLDEFIISQTAQRFGIDNTPSEEVIDCLKILCDTILQPARDVFGPIKISSGYRCPKLNRLVGGRETSGHKLGYCADIIPLNTTKRELAKWLSKNVPFDQLILEFGTVEEPAWIHVSSDPRLRHQTLQVIYKSRPVKIQL